ncbi:MAG: hypothetical protein LBQ39_01920 [Tannerellaceae bacterium]|jgi:hypothetical protein|nr:hypothetical protein [Tannerellaceae bacterium]
MDDFKRMLACPPVKIVDNPYYNPNRTPVQSVADLGGTEMDEFYMGAAEGYAWVRDGHVVAFYYEEEEYPAQEPENAKRYDVSFSGHQICFRERIEGKDNPRFTIEKSKDTPGHWVCTDTQDGIICTFKEKYFNATQEFVVGKGAKPADFMKLASAAREMGDWLRENHYEKIFP